MYIYIISYIHIYNIYIYIYIYIIYIYIYNLFAFQYTLCSYQIKTDALIENPFIFHMPLCTLQMLIKLLPASMSHPKRAKVSFIQFQTLGMPVSEDTYLCSL